MASDPQPPDVITSDGLPDGWTFHTIEHGEHVTYEVRTEHRFLIMSSTWNREFPPPGQLGRGVWEAA